MPHKSQKVNVGPILLSNLQVFCRYCQLPKRGRAQDHVLVYNSSLEFLWGLFFNLVFHNIGTSKEYKLWCSTSWNLGMSSYVPDWIPIVYFCSNTTDWMLSSSRGIVWEAHAVSSSHSWQSDHYRRWCQWDLSTVKWQFYLLLLVTFFWGDIFKHIRVLFTHSCYHYWWILTESIIS